MISPTNTHPGLTRRDPLPRMAPGASRRCTTRPACATTSGSCPGDDLQGAAHAVLAKRLGLERVYLLSERSSFWDGLLTDPFRRAARRLGVGVAGVGVVRPAGEELRRARGQGRPLGRGRGRRRRRPLRRRRPAGEGAARAPRRHASRSWAASSSRRRSRSSASGKAAHGMYVTTTDLPRATLPMTAAGRRFARDIGAPATEYLGVLEAGQAAELVLDAIARSDGTRASRAARSCRPARSRTASSAASASTPTAT